MRSLATAFLFLLSAMALLAAQPGAARAQTAFETQRSSMYLRESRTRPAIMKNDILLVMVIENDVASNDAKLESRRKTETNLLFDSWVKFSGSGFGLEPDNSQQPDIELEGERKTNGRGKTDRHEAMRMRIAARVVDVRPNGNLIIEARKERRINDEKTVVTLTGEVRATDVQADYSLTSDRVVDLKLSYSGKGPVSSNVAWTWFTWVVDLIWPF